MPEGVVAQARTLEHAERTVSLDYPTLKGKSGDLYLTDRLATLRTLKLAKDVTKTVTKTDRSSSVLISRVLLSENRLQSTCSK